MRHTPLLLLICAIAPGLAAQMPPAQRLACYVVTPALDSTLQWYPVEAPKRRDAGVALPLRRAVVIARGGTVSQFLLALDSTRIGQLGNGVRALPWPAEDAAHLLLATADDMGAWQLTADSTFVFLVRSEQAGGERLEWRHRAKPLAARYTVWRHGDRELLGSATLSPLPCP